MATSTIVSGGRRGTWSHPHSFHVAGVALTALGGLWWRTGFSADAVDAAALCVAGVALGVIDRPFAWQAWHLETSTVTLRGRRGTWRHLPSFCVAGVALGDIHLLSHTIFHTPLCHPPSLTHLSHTTFSHTIFDTPLCHTPSFTHTIFDTPSFTHHLCHTPSFTHHLSHTIFHAQLCNTPSFTHRLHTALCHPPSLSPTIFDTPSLTPHL